MTVPNSKASSILWNAMRYLDHLVFPGKASVGSLVFVYSKDEYRWIPAWVIDETSGRYEVEAAYGDVRISGLEASQMGRAVDKNGNMSIFA